MAGRKSNPRGRSPAEEERYRRETVHAFRARETDRKTNRNLRYFFAGLAVIGLVIFATTGSSLGLVLGGGGLLGLRRLGRARSDRLPF